MKRINKKWIIFCVALFSFVLLIPSIAVAQNDDDSQYSTYLKNYDMSSFVDEIDDETYGFLEDLGLTDFDYNSLLELTPKKIANTIKDMFFNSFKSPIATMTEILALVILSSFMQCLKTTVNRSSLNDVFSLASAIIVAIILVVKMNNVFTISCSAISICSNFIYAFVPVFAVIVATSGGITTAFSTNALLLGLAQILNIVSANIFLPIINCYLGIGIVSGIRPQLNVGALLDVMKRFITIAISTCAAVFVSILSIKTAVAGRADALGLRSIRFAINSVVPVIGSAISEGLLSIQSYSSLIKSSVGVVGIIAVALIFLPSIIEVSVWRFCLSLASVCADVFEDYSVSSVLGAFRNALLLVDVVLILSMVTTIISVGILIAAKTQGG